MDIGYIKLHRKMADWEWYRDTNTFRLFIHLLLKANWEDGKYHGYDVPRGSLVIGRKNLSLELGITERETRTALEHLKQTGEVTIKSTNKFSIVTIVKYCDFQDKSSIKKPTNDQQLTTNRPTKSQQTTTSKEIKNINNIYLEKENIKEKEKVSRIELPFSEKFSEVWKRWKKHRAEIRHKLTPETEKSQLEKLSKYSELEAVAMIEQSIDNGWQGLFEIKNQPQKQIPKKKNDLSWLNDVNLGDEDAFNR